MTVLTPSSAHRAALGRMTGRAWKALPCYRLIAVANVEVTMDTAPDFELPAHDGRPWHLRTPLERGPVVVVFYRGDW
jgi:hypothetical protein